jgi:hypothetical protein
MNPTNYPKHINKKLHFIAEETSLTQEVNRRLVGRSIAENSYILISSKEKKEKIERFQMNQEQLQFV